MNRQTFNQTVAGLNSRLLWVNTRQILPEPNEGHVTLAKITDLQDRFKALLGQFVHESPVMQAVLANRWEPTSDPNLWNNIGTQNIGSVPNFFRYWIQGWDVNRAFTPMQHIAPKVWQSQPNHGVLTDWESVMADIRTGTAQLKALPYTTWKKESYSRTESGTGFLTFGGGEIQEETTTITEGGSANISLSQTAEMACDSASAPTSTTNWIRGGVGKLTLKNPHHYPIKITLLVTIIPTGGGGHYFVPGCGTCTADYTVPEPEWVPFLGSEIISANTFVAKFENSIKNARYETQTVTLSARSQQAWGPTNLNDFGAPGLCRTLWNMAQERGRQSYCECQGGRVFSILAYYEPQTT